MYQQCCKLMKRGIHTIKLASNLRKCSVGSSVLGTMALFLHNLFLYQVGPKPLTFRWKGRNSTTNRELNPKASYISSSSRLVVGYTLDIWTNSHHGCSVCLAVSLIVTASDPNQWFR